MRLGFQGVTLGAGGHFTVRSHAGPTRLVTLGLGVYGLGFVSEFSLHAAKMPTRVS